MPLEYIVVILNGLLTLLLSDFARSLRIFASLQSVPFVEGSIVWCTMVNGGMVTITTNPKTSPLQRFCCTVNLEATTKE